MSLRPIDLQINFLREVDARGQRVKEGIHEAGAQRYAADLEKERRLRDEAVRELEKTGLDAVKEEERRRREEAEKRKRGAKSPPGEEPAQGPSSGPSAEPTKGSIIDIRFA